ncbi:MAG: hypothetical protein JHC22_00600 [Thermoproteus sp.]|nr:hypothetical protein [Thermoproteus sp.]
MLRLGSLEIGPGHCYREGSVAIWEASKRPREAAGAYGQLPDLLKFRRHPIT